MAPLAATEVHFAPAVGAHLLYLLRYWADFEAFSIFMVCDADGLPELPPSHNTPSYA